MSAPCYGLHELFDSQHSSDHEQAATICRGCPVIDACERDAASLEYKGGTWHGHLYGRVSDDGITEAAARKAHTRYAAGDRSIATVHGEVVYQRKRKRRAYHLERARQKRAAA